MNEDMRNGLILFIILIILLMANCSEEIIKPRKYYPWPHIEVLSAINYPFNLVGDNTILRMFLSLDAIKWIVVEIDGQKVASLSSNPPNKYFTPLDNYIDVEKFGKPGRKELVLMGGNEGEYIFKKRIEIINDNAALMKQGYDYIKKHNLLNYGLWLAMMGRRIYIYKKIGPACDSVIERALADWKKWGGLEFIYTNEIKDNTIIITRGVYTFAGCEEKYDKYLCRIGIVNVSTRPCVDENVMAHELGHVLGLDHDNFPYALMGKMELNLYPFQQAGIKLLYSTNPPGLLFH